MSIESFAKTAERLRVDQQCYQECSLGALDACADEITSGSDDEHEKSAQLDRWRAGFYFGNSNWLPGPPGVVAKLDGFLQKECSALCRSPAFKDVIEYDRSFPFASGEPSAIRRGMRILVQTSENPNLCSELFDPETETIPELSPKEQERQTDPANFSPLAPEATTAPLWSGAKWGGLAWLGWKIISGAKAAVQVAYGAALLLMPANLTESSPYGEPPAA